jgi:hypothetical protein
MSKLIIFTQYCENYGSAEEPYWKLKGGFEYVVEGLDFDADYEWAEARVDQILNKVRDQVEVANDFCEEFILGWSIHSDDYLTDFERTQLEYDGKIEYPTKVLEVSENA